jgi:hypothetical protein
LDVNHNPYAAATVNPGYLFNYAAVSNSGTRQGGDEYIALAIAGQSIADGGFTDAGGAWSEANYDISTYTTGNTWVGLYANQGLNLKKAMDIASASGNKYTIAQCKVLLAYSFYQATMLYGDVPCSQALDVEQYKTPVFDPQKNVLESCLTLLDDAISLASAPGGGDAITDYDIYYKGDMTKWLKLARSLKLQVLMVMVDKDPSKAAALGTLINQGGFIASSDDNWIFPYYSTAGNQNPTFRLDDKYASMGSYYLFYAHNSVLNPMKQYADPRLPVYFIKGTDGNYNGLETSADVVLDSKNKYISSPINYPVVWSATASDVLLSIQDVDFLLAEAYTRGLGVTKDIAKAQSYFNDGVKSSCVFWNISDSKATDFVASLPSLTSLTDDNARLTLINTQYWISLMTRPFEAFVNQRRSLVPSLSVPATAPYKTLMHRLEYPPREKSVNPNVPSPLPLITDKMWFEK